MTHGARSACGTAALVLLTTAACLLAEGRADEQPLKDAGVVAKGEDDASLHTELSTLLTELREIADSIDAVRKEHGKLAKGVNEISNAVKDMNERSEHIKKKVRKMSKALNKNGHHHKLKNSLRSLQKDHQKILQAMMNSSFTHHRNKGGNHTAGHKNKSGNAHPATSRKHLKVAVPPQVNASTPDATSNEVLPSSSSSSTTTTRQPHTVSPTPSVTKTAPKTTTEKDNTIPEPVVEPRDGSDPPKKIIPLPVDCTEVIQMGNMTSGVYRIQPKGLPNPIKVIR